MQRGGFARGRGASFAGGGSARGGGAGQQGGYSNQQDRQSDNAWNESQQQQQPAGVSAEGWGGASNPPAQAAVSADGWDESGGGGGGATVDAWGCEVQDDPWSEPAQPQQQQKNFAGGGQAGRNAPSQPPQAVHNQSGANRDSSGGGPQFNTAPAAAANMTDYSGGFGGRGGRGGGGFGGGRGAFNTARGNPASQQNSFNNRSQQQEQFNDQPDDARNSYNDPGGGSQRFAQPSSRGGGQFGGGGGNAFNRNGGGAQGGGNAGETWDGEPQDAWGNDNNQAAAANDNSFNRTPPARGALNSARGRGGGFGRSNADDNSFGSQQGRGGGFGSDNGQFGGQGSDAGGGFGGSGGGGGGFGAQGSGGGGGFGGGGGGGNFARGANREEANGNGGGSFPPPRGRFAGSGGGGFDQQDNAFGGGGGFRGGRGGRGGGGGGFNSDNGFNQSQAPRNGFSAGGSQGFDNTGFGQRAGSAFDNGPSQISPRGAFRGGARGGCGGSFARNDDDAGASGGGFGGGGFRGGGGRGGFGRGGGFGGASANGDDPFGGRSGFSGRGRPTGNTGGRDFGQRNFDDDAKNAGDSGNRSGPPPPTEYYVPTERTVEDILKDDELNAHQQDFYDEDDDIEVNGLNEDQPPTVLDTWADANFAPELLANVEKSKYTRPRKIQAHTIPLILDGHDIKGHAETGSGKSAAFLLPLIEWVIRQKKAGVSSRACAPFALIIEPTRELALQLSEQARKFCEGLPKEIEVKVAKAYGSYQFRENMQEIMRGCDILIGTVGRLYHLSQRNMIFDLLHFLVLDEADRLLDDSFMPQLRDITESKGFPDKDKRQTLLFSATFPEHIQMFSEEILRKGNIMVSRKARKLVSANSRVTQNFVLVQAHEKKDKLFEMLEKDKENAEKANAEDYKLAFRRTLIFVNTKNDANILCNALTAFGIPTASVNADLPQQQREEALARFRDRRLCALVCTNVLARGMDIQGLDHVINMDLPDEFSTYVHRIGRTGRLHEGIATSFFDPNGGMDGRIVRELIEGVRDAGQEPPQFLLEAAEGKSVFDTNDDEEWGAPPGFSGAGPSSSFGAATSAPPQQAAAVTTDDNDEWG